MRTAEFSYTTFWAQRQSLNGTIIILLDVLDVSALHAGAEKRASRQILTHRLQFMALTIRSLEQPAPIVRMNALGVNP